MYRSLLFKNLGIGLLAGSILTLALLVLPSASIKHVSAQSTQNQITGWMWSSTIGWISLSGNGYGLTLNSDNTITGSAWSSNIGWVKFGELSNFPSGSGTQAVNAQLSGSNLIGWARACGGTSSGDCSSMTRRTDGWDGWIYLGSTGHGDGIAINNNAGSGYAWGADVVGWLTPINMQVTYTPQNQCSANGTQSIYTDSQGNKIVTQCPQGCDTSTKLCIPCAVSDQCSVDGTQSIHTDAQCNKTSAQCSAGCNQGTKVCNQPPPPPAGVVSGCLSVNTVPPTCTKTAKVRSGAQVHLYWSVTNVNACTITGNGDRFANRTGNDNTLSSAINAKTTYIITCTGPNGKQFNDSVNISLIPSFKEI